jgi:hypothetical protein
VISQAERRELRSLVRQRVKVLRAEVDQRRAELDVELEQAITERFADEDKAWADAMFIIDEAAREANRKANDVMRELRGDAWPKHDVNVVGLYTPATERPTNERRTLRYEGQRRIQAQVQAAYLKLSQQEADLLTRLAMDVLESAEARSFLVDIPTVSSLVPSVRLLELEQSLKESL